MGIKPLFPDYQASAGRLLYYQFAKEQQDNPPTLAFCPQCNDVHKLHWYGIGWCDECAMKANYLPDTAHELEDLILWRMMFNELRSKAHNWEEIKHVARWWSVNRRVLIRGEFKPDWIQDALRSPAVVAVCAWKGCGQALGLAAIKAYCGTTCYQRAWRRDNKETIQLRRVLKKMPPTKQQLADQGKDD